MDGFAFANAFLALKDLHRIASRNVSSHRIATLIKLAATTSVSIHALELAEPMRFAKWSITIPSALVLLTSSESPCTLAVSLKIKVTLALDVLGEGACLCHND